jgi:hypothetical protein
MLSLAYGRIGERLCTSLSLCYLGEVQITQLQKHKVLISIRSKRHYV